MSETYAELPLLKEFMSIPAAEDSRDNLLMLALRAASRQVDKDTGRRFWLDMAAAARVFDVDGRVDGTRLSVYDIGDAAGLVVEVGTYGSWTVLPDGSVTAGPVDAAGDGRPYEWLHRAAGWPAGRQVRVTAAWGYPGVPEDIVTATLIRAAALFKRKDSTEGVLGTGEWGAVRVSSRKDPDYAQLIGPYTRGAVFA